MASAEGASAPRSIFELIYEDHQRLRASRLAALAALWQPPPEPEAGMFNLDPA